MNGSEYLEARRELVDRFLETWVPPGPERLVEAMRYTLFSGGKRLRPVLALAAGEAVGAPTAAVLPFACGIELIHSYSLVHDDLPAMDDDRFRRGRPTNHVVFGEALAILAGDALLTEAFRIMASAAAKTGVPPGVALDVLAEIAEAAGARGMVAGQAADMAAESTPADLPTVEFIHIRKTGALLRAAVRAGALVGGAKPEDLRRLTRYGECLGLAFQVADDILDAEGTFLSTGKQPGADRARHKATFPRAIGLPAAKERCRDLLRGAIEAIEPLGEPARPLALIANFVVERACPPSPTPAEPT